MEFIKISAGEFLMGAPKSDTMKWDGETPQHKVIIEEEFYMQETEVTQGQWKAVMGMGSNPSRSGQGDNYPVDSVSWNDVQEFIAKLNKQSGKNYRLPTEAEWEYAARAGTTTKWYCGDNESCLDSIAWYEANAERKTHLVGTKQPNKWGLYDMSGNVFEWVEDDWHDSYTDAPKVGNAWIDEPRGSRRVIRGGGWSGHAGSCRSSNRSRSGPSIDYYDLGFRLVLPQAI
ncbi:MAG: formylglycine-generating enzyme family protein, partial [Gammaproteobacteria bacterium]|nr:formylglycine-generating enzyme family protein [Gammaproteobacteria bacterium]